MSLVSCPKCGQQGLCCQCHLKSVDPNYGAQQHQCEYLERMRRAQELNPCAVDHSQGLPLIAGTPMPGPPCHRTSCYPADASGRMVGS